LRPEQAYTSPQLTRNSTLRLLALWRVSQKRDRVLLRVTRPEPELGLKEKRESAGNTRIRPFGMLPSRLPDLPPEIWEYILHFVPEPAICDVKLVSRPLHIGGRKRGGVGQEAKYRDLSKVNRQLRELIAGSTSIQYRLELYRAGYEDNARASQPPIATRREQLKEYQTGWLDGGHAVLVREVFKGTSGPELTGDTLVTMGRARMCFVKLPSKAKRLPTQGWTVDLAFDGWSVAMHPPTNVVAVSEYTGSISYASFP